jgi:TatD DNase family protein
MPAALIDTHCHLDFERYDGDRTAVLARADEAGLVALINPSIDPANSAVVCALAAANGPVFAAVGVHPNSAAEVEDDWLGTIRRLAGREKVVAIGEIGLDYYRDYSPKDVQWRALEAQLSLAADLRLPVIIHNREASEDVIAMLGQWVNALPGDHPQRTRPGVLHSFSAPQAIAEQALALGFYIGITGPVTFKKADDLRHIVAHVPMDRLLLETDGPFLAPHPHRGKRNEPAYVQFMADRIAGLHMTTFEAVAHQTSANAIRLFALPIELPA